MIAAISRDDLKAKLERRERFRLVEAQPEEKFQQGHLPRAIDLPPDQIKQLAPQALPDRNEEIVVYCGSSSCTASDTAARELEAQGYTNVRRYVGGKKDWTDAGLPLESAPAPASVAP